MIFRRSKRSSSTSSSPKHNISRISTGSTNTSPIRTSIGTGAGAGADSSIGLLSSPKKVIKALYDYRPQGPGELAFNNGDFFHVIGGDVDGQDPDGWYEATNPMTGARGMVPVSYFEVFNRSRPAVIGGGGANDNNDDVFGKPASPPQSGQAHITHNGSPSAYYGQQQQHQNASGRASAQNLYAVTLYDFEAERPDELDIFVGENLIICAHHEFEWFIAKPINRLGGPGLVPVSYVKVIDLITPNGQASKDEADDIVTLIQRFKIPTVEQWKDQTARYQASTIPLGSISNNSTPPALSSNTHFFGNDIGGNGSGANGSNRSSLSSTNTTIIEASVDSYQLDHGRYQYLIVAKLSNGKTRFLSRYYQDFYDLQVKLLELFPYEAGKIENSKRIIPSIPGPLINVNDSISKLRREKLDYYLRNLIALPSNISRSEEVLTLFEVLENGFDKEVVDGKKERRILKPISQKSYYHQDRLSQYSNFPPVPNAENPHHQRTRSASSSNLLNQEAGSEGEDSNDINNTINNSSNTTYNNITTNTASSNPTSTATNGPSSSSGKKVKVKFYYEDDIFVLLLPTNLRLQDLKSKLTKRLLTSNETSVEQIKDVHLYLKNDYDDFAEDHNLLEDEEKELTETQILQLQALEINSDERFHDNLYDKCKLTIIL